MDISVLKTVISERDLAEGFYSRACCSDNWSPPLSGRIFTAARSRGFYL